MKRYDLESTGWGREEMVERPLGDWCKYDEVDDECAKDKEENEKMREIINNMTAESLEHLAEIARLRKALEFYADLSNYNDRWENDVYHINDIDQDCGAVAREALEGE